MKASSARFISPDSFGLRWITLTDATLFSVWEKGERPYPWTGPQFMETQSGDKVRSLVWEEQGAVMGYAVVQIVDEEAYLLNFMVSPRLRRRGYGRRLMEKVMMWCHACGSRRLMLDVEENNRSAIQLYHRTGFESLQLRKKAYPNGENMVSMKTTLLEA